MLRKVRADPSMGASVRGSRFDAPALTVAGDQVGSLECLAVHERRQQIANPAFVVGHSQSVHAPELRQAWILLARGSDTAISTTVSSPDPSTSFHLMLLFAGVRRWRLVCCRCPWDWWDLRPERLSIDCSARHAKHGVGTRAAHPYARLTNISSLTKNTTTLKGEQFSVSPISAH